MNQSKIPTAEEFFNQYGGYTREQMLLKAKEFALAHTKAALQAAAEKANIKTEYYHEDDFGIKKIIEILENAKIASERTDGDGMLYAVDTYEISKDSILNAYPESNIK